LLPPGYVVDETPDPLQVDVDFASYRSNVKAEGNVLHYEREYIVRQVEISAEKADDFRKLESAILFDEKARRCSRSSNLAGPRHARGAVPHLECPQLIPYNSFVRC
jgi:hypothetical protein